MTNLKDLKFDDKNFNKHTEKVFLIDNKKE